LKSAACGSLKILDAKIAKISHLATIAQCFVGLYLRNEGMHRQSEKLVKLQYLLHMSSQYMANFGPLTAEIGSGVWGTPANFNGFRVTAETSLTGGQPNFARCLAVSWAGTLYIHFRGLLPPDGILPSAVFTVRPSLAFSCIGSVTARQSSSGRQPKFAAWYKEWNSGTFAEGATYIRPDGHHVGHRATL